MRPLSVYLHGEPIGTLTTDARRSTFTYEGRYQIDRTATPLSLSIPLSRSRHDPTAVNPYLWGLLPDNAETLQQWAAAADPRADENNAASLLLHYGADCAGAVQFFDAEIDRPPARISGLIPVDDAKIGEQLRAIKRSPGAWVLDDTTGRFSLGGAQAKFSLSLSDQGWAQPTGDLPSTHIFKPGIPEYHDQAMNEHLTLSIARELGLNAADTEILNFDGEQAIVVTRYDRETRPDGEVARIHQEDFAQALSVSPSQKYEDQGGPTISQMSALLRRHQSSTRAKKSMEQFLTSVFFNWLVLAPDAHAKNYSVLLRRGDVDLAPLYDVASIAPYPERYRSNTVKLAQSVGGNMQVDRVGRTEWMTEASSLGLDAEMFLDHCARLALRASSAVKAVCGRQRMRGVDPAFVTAYEEAVLERIEFAASVIMADD